MDGLRESCARAELAMPETRIERFEATTLPAAHLVNSSFALPLCPPRVFAEVWNGIRAALVSGGRFLGAAVRRPG